MTSRDSSNPASTNSRLLPRLRTGRPSARTTAGWATGLLLVAGFVVPVDFVTEEPGPTFNTIGDYEGHQLISIDGAKTYDVSGNLDMTTVSVAGGPNTTLTAVPALASWLSSTGTVLPSDLLYQPTVTSEQVVEQNTADMTNSQEIAQAAALNYLGKPVKEKLKVASLTENSPSQGKIQEDDILLKLGSTTLENYGQIAEILDKNRDKPLAVTVSRDGKEITETITPQRSDDHGRYLLGLALDRSYEFPFKVKYGLEEVGGPSAGMMFALGIIDELTEGKMTGGVHFAGTGTIESNGDVGPIGGIAQKMVGAKDAGATVFLAPADNCDEVVGHIPEGLSVVKVSNLTEAADAVKKIGAGEDPSTFPTCTAE
ncbi:PDZ domain-containing protein [Rothia amarae]|uniref:YlbL family protein n=1 Tax=Rothia amarae TaxID=169480 RepID=UPI0031D5D8DE